MPPVLIGSTWAAFRWFAHLWGARPGYFAGFLFYWCVWCLALPLALLGRARVRALLRPPPIPLRRQGPVIALSLVVPVVLVYAYEFPRVIGMATPIVLAGSAAIALVNGALEELLWRGAFVEVFPNDRLLGYVYPSVAFALWHVAPQSIFANPAPGGRASLVAVSLVLGLLWGNVARRTGSIRWTSVAHILFDFSGLGARLYVGVG
jgi:membrane protease YdiL (CAAX protease family)